MKKFVCELCGSSNLSKQGDHFVCNDCNTSYSIEEAKKLLVEVEDSIDNNPELKNLYELARRARKEGNSENAEKYYSQIAIKCPYDWESNFFQVLCNAERCKIGEIGLAQDKLLGAVKTAVSLINDHLKTDAEKIAACREIVDATLPVAKGGFYSAQNWYNDCGWSIRRKFLQDMLNYTYPCILTLYALGDEIDKYFGTKYDELHVLCVDAWKSGVEFHEKILSFLADQNRHSAEINEHKNKYLRYESNYGGSYNQNSIDIYQQNSKDDLNTNTNTNYSQQPQTKVNGMAIAGLILAFIIPLLGWIFGGIGLNNAKKCNSGKGLAIAALIVATLNWLISMFMQLGSI